MGREVGGYEIEVLEVNISCPTSDPKGGIFALHEEHTFNVMSLIRKTTDKPIWCKLSPNAGDVVAIAKAAEAAGGRALVGWNTLLRLENDVNSFRPADRHNLRRRSGAGLQAILLRIGHPLARDFKTPLLGVP